MLDRLFRWFLPLLLLTLQVQWVHAQQDRALRIVAIGAHPDDADIRFGGTAALFAQMGHHVKFVSITNGDAGHYDEGGGMLAARRMAEAREAGRRLGIDEYVVLDNHDAELMPNLHIRHQLIREIRKWNADVVLSHRPNDYHPDHRYAGTLVMDAAFLVIVPNVTPDTPALESNPLFLYYQDRFTNPSPFRPDIAVDISETFDTKIEGLAAHESQFFEWLAWLDGRLDEVPEGETERIEWLKGVRAQPVNGAVRESLGRWYGEEHAARVNHAEAFEIAEYGYQPSPEDIRRLFPMLNRKP